MAAVVATFLFPEAAQYPASNFPQFVRNQGSAFPVSGLAYDAATKETAFYKFRAFNYGASNTTISVEIDWYADTATSGDVIWGAQIAAITPDTDTQDVETKALAAASTVTDTHLGTVGQRLHRATITVANLDSIATNDVVWMAVYRDAAAAGDTMTGDAIFIKACVAWSDT